MSFQDRCFEWLCSTHEVKQIGKMYHYSCQECGESIGRSGHYHRDTNTIRCFQSSCKYSSWTSIREYICDIEKISVNAIGSFLNSNFVSSGFKQVDINTPKVVRPDKCRLPKEFMPITEGRGLITDRAIRYLYDRGLEDVEFLDRRYSLGYVKDASSRYFKRLIFPFKNSLGKLVYFQARDFFGSKMRWLNPKEEEISLGKSQVVFNEWNMSLYREEIFVCEGIFDVLTMDNAVGIQGKSISLSQVSILSEFFCNSFFVLFDEGAWKDSLDTAIKIRRASGKDVYCIDMDKGDANEMGRDYVLQRKDQAVLVTEASYLEELSSLIIIGDKTYRGTSEIKYLW